VQPLPAKSSDVILGYCKRHDGAEEVGHNYHAGKSDRRKRRLKHDTVCLCLCRYIKDSFGYGVYTSIFVQLVRQYNNVWMGTCFFFFNFVPKVKLKVVMIETLSWNIRFTGIIII